MSRSGRSEIAVRGDQDFSLELSKGPMASTLVRSPLRSVLRELHIFSSLSEPNAWVLGGSPS